MLGVVARQYYDKGYNCSQCLIKACESVYDIPITKQCYKMCSTVYNGFGICGICSVLVAGVMILGLLFDEENSKSLRIKFLSAFSEKHNCLNCSMLKTGNDCGDLIEDVGEILEKIISEAR